MSVPGAGGAQGRGSVGAVGRSAADPSRPDASTLHALRGPVVITGAAGFMGAHLVRTVAALGADVRAVDVAPRPARFAGLPIEYRQKDIRDPAAFRDIFRGADTVFHLASAHLQVRAPADWYHDVNVRGVKGLVRASADAGVRRFVHTSSVGIYGHVAAPPADEDAPKGPGNAYERTKLAGEEAALRTASDAGIELVVLRPSWVYGPGCPRTTKLLRTVARGRFFYVGDGSNLRHPLYVSEGSEAFLRAAGASVDACGRAYLVVGPRAVTVRELVEASAHALGVPAPNRSLPAPLVRSLAWGVEAGFRVLRRDPPISRRSLAFFENDNAFDGGRAREALGFEARIELPEGLARTLEAASSAGDRSAA